MALSITDDMSSNQPVQVSPPSSPREKHWFLDRLEPESAAYWRRVLDGCDTYLELPATRPSMPIPAGQASSYTVSLPGALADALKALSLQEGVTLETTLIAAFQVLLSRYSGQNDIVIGIRTGDCSQADASTPTGPFANCLILRGDLSGSPIFRALLRQVRETVREARTHQALPLADLYKEWQSQQQPARNPLFQVMLSFASSSRAQSEELAIAQREIETDMYGCDLSLELEIRAEGLTARFRYISGVFNEATVVRLAGHWQTLLEGIVADSTRRLTELPLLTEEERYQLLVEWNATQAGPPADQWVQQLFEAQVKRTPEAIALVCGDQQLTYRDLNARANQLAHYLRELGVGPEVLVGLCVGRSLELIIGLLATLKAGGAYVPLDPAFPPERLSFMLEDTQAPVLITQERLVEKLPAPHPRLVCLDADWQTITRYSAENPPAEATGEQLAYVIYTSGSTGRPKGVLSEHHALAAHCLAVIQTFELQAEDHILQFTPFTFDPSLEQILSALLVGARLVMRGEEIWSPADLLRAVKNFELTVINFPPAYWHQILQEWTRAPEQLLGHHIRLVIIGGDQPPLEIRDLWQQMPLRATRFLNVYGPTEATITATYFDVTAAQGRSLEKIPIGRPLPGRKLYVLDDAGNPVPVGVAGELYIGGDLLARGYLNRPDLTRERFIPDPFSQQPQARLYKTGDLVRYLPDGSIEFLARVDQQVKIQGIRVELGEIEEALSQHPAVRQVVVIAREDLPGARRLVAYAVLYEEQAISVNDLKAHVEKLVPAYMVPSAFVLLEELPLTSSGKVDRRALPAPELKRSLEQESFVAPALPLHHQLVQIWEDLFGIQPIGIQDDFFDLGGHSLLAARLFDRIEQVCGKKLPTTTLLAGATIAHLVEALTSEAQIVNKNALIALQTDGFKRPFFYLHGQLNDELALHCYPLARALGSDQPFYGLNPYLLDSQRGLPTLEEIAASHIKTIRAIQPEGPYLLGGCCNGGLVVYEVARQLRAQGQAVDALILIEPAFLVYPAPYRWYYNLFAGLGKLLHLSKSKRLDWALRLKHLLRILIYRLLRKEDPEHLTFRDLSKHYFLLYDWIILGYRPADLYDGKVTFFWAKESNDGKQYRKGWRTIEAKGQSEIYNVPGDHMTCRTEHLPVLAEQLNSCIRQAQASESPKGPGKQ